MIRTSTDETYRWSYRRGKNWSARYSSLKIFYQHVRNELIILQMLNKRYILAVYYKLLCVNVSNGNLPSETNIRLARVNWECPSPNLAPFRNEHQLPANGEYTNKINGPTLALQTIIIAVQFMFFFNSSNTFYCPFHYIQNVNQHHRQIIMKCHINVPWPQLWLQSTIRGTNILTFTKSLRFLRLPDWLWNGRELV